LREVNN